MSLVYFRNWVGEKIDKKNFEYDKGDQPLVDFFNKRVEDFIEQRRKKTNKNNSNVVRFETYNLN
jgi:hypothetical protein